MSARLGSRVIAAACVVIAAPIVLIAISGLPAVVLSVGDYYRALNVSGTASFHQDMANHLKQSIITVGFFAGSSAAWFGNVLIAKDPRPRRDQFVWLFSSAVIAAHLFTNARSLQAMNRDGILLFGGIPMLVGVLSLVGLWVSRKAMRLGK